MTFGELGQEAVSSSFCPFFFFLEFILLYFCPKVNVRIRDVLCWGVCREMFAAGQVLRAGGWEGQSWLPGSFTKGTFTSGGGHQTVEVSSPSLPPPENGPTLMTEVLGGRT